MLNNIEDAHRLSAVQKQDRPEQPKSPSRSPRRQWHNQGNSNQGQVQGQNKPCCFICNKTGLIARNCFKRIQANAMVSQAAECELEPEEVTQAMSVRQSGSRQGQRFQPDTGIHLNNPDAPAQASYSKQWSNFVSHPDGQFMPRYTCKLHNCVSCPQCHNVPNTGQHSCGAMIQQEIVFPCGCVVPFFDETCNLCRSHGTRMPTVEGQLFDKGINVFRDTGRSTVVVRL